MRYRLWVFAAASAVMSGFPAYAQETFPLGIWTDARHRMVVRIAPCDGDRNSFCGTVISDNRRGRPTNQSGHMVIRSLVPERTHWAGQAYDGTTRSNFTLHPSADGRVKARLCIIGILCLNEYVQRVSTLAARAR